MVDQLLQIICVVILDSIEIRRDCHPDQFSLCHPCSCALLYIWRQFILGWFSSWCIWQWSRSLLVDHLRIDFLAVFHVNCLTFTDSAAAFKRIGKFSSDLVWAESTGLLVVLNSSRFILVFIHHLFRENRCNFSIPCLPTHTNSYTFFVFPTSVVRFRLNNNVNALTSCAGKLRMNSCTYIALCVFLYGISDWTWVWMFGRTQ